MFSTEMQERDSTVRDCWMALEQLQRMAKDQAQNLIESASTPLSCMCVRMEVSDDRALITREEMSENDEQKIILKKLLKNTR